MRDLRGDLLHEFRKRSVTWQDPSLFIREPRNVVLHLHGHRDRPDSIVLGTMDYASIATHQVAQEMQRALSVTRTLLLVGFGAGLDDPNFEALRTWMRDVWGDAGFRHYRLCLKRELPKLDRQHEDEQIYPLPYGTAHKDLARYPNAPGDELGRRPGRYRGWRSSAPGRGRRHRGRLAGRRPAAGARAGGLAARRHRRGRAGQPGLDKDLEPLGSIATSPVVLAVPRSAMARVSQARTVPWRTMVDWARSTAPGPHLRIGRPDPTSSTAGLLATIELNTKGGSPATPDSRHAVEQAVDPVGDELTELCELGRAGPPGPCSSPSRRWSPTTATPGTPVLDHPFVLLPAAAELDARARLARDFFAYLTGPDAQEDLREAGFRDTARNVGGSLGADDGVLVHDPPAWARGRPTGRRSPAS
jgi:hypothetical protein